jgi:hypothetical protein
MISIGLYQLLSREFPNLSLQDAEGQTTTKPEDAVTIGFPFTVNGRTLSNVSISLADEGSIKLLGSNNVSDEKWFNTLEKIKQFAKANRLEFQPNIQGKNQLDKRDSKDTAMEESSLYGSSKSSYQNMESTKLIIRHSKKIQEGSLNSRTRNIDALYIQNESGERFRYPYPHLSGARAMQRHVANGGNPYDHFGHYIISLSEQVYNYRRVGNLLARKSFMENSEIFEIAEKSKKKVKDIKKILERIQRQNGYLVIRENFTTFKKKEMDEETLNELRSTFTTQQFNEELVELFPYISDLIGEEVDQVNEDLPDSYSIRNTETDTDKIYHISKYPITTNHSIYKKIKAKDPKAQIYKNGQPMKEELDEISDKLAKKVKHQRMRDYAAADDNATGGSPEEEKAWNKLSKNSDIMDKRSKRKEIEVDEAKDDVPDDVFFADPKNAPSADWVAQDAKAKSFPTRGDVAGRHGGMIANLEKAVQEAPFIEVEPYGKDFIMKAIAITDRQLKQLEAKSTEPTRDRNAANQIKWGIEKATARMGILQKRLETAELGTTQNSVAIEHLAQHIKNNDGLSNLLLAASDEYNGMATADKKRIISIIRQIQSKQKYVGLFTNESIGYEDLEMSLVESKKDSNRVIEGIDPVIEFIKNLRIAIGEDKDDDDDDDENMDDDCDCETDEEDMVKPRPDKAEKTGDPGDVVEFVKSLYNSEENSFPRGEEGVVISAVKEFGDEAESVARRAEEALKAQGEERGIANPNSDMMRMKQLAGLAPINNF